MKRFDNSEYVFSDNDIESCSEEIDIILGEKYGAVNVIGSRLENVIPFYSEKAFYPEMIGNEDEAKEANELVRYPKSRLHKQDVQH